MPGLLLLVGGGMLALLMVYILVWEGRSVLPRADGAAGVAVFFPDRRDWEDFREGARAAAGRGAAKVVRDDADAITLQGSRSGKLVRFTWHGVGGLIETREEVRRLADAPEAPLAIIGSSNTVLTAALAEALRDSAEAAGSGKAGPVLLVPWATSVSVDAPGLGPGTVPLLGIYPGRTFRFCADNQRLADLAVECLAAREPRKLPRRAILVVDRADSFSKDLADCFARAISAAAPKAGVDTYDLQSEEAVGPRRPDDGFGPSEQQLARRLWRATLEVPGHEMAWIVLPLQEEPTLRMLKALRGEVWWDVGKGEEASPLHVICGDGLGRDTMQDLAATHNLPFPVWGVSSSSGPAPSGPGAPKPGSVVGSSSRQVPGEIASALLHCLDVPGAGAGAGAGASTPEGLRVALAALDLKADDPAALGRPLAFAPSGQRRSEDLGRVLEVQPGRAALSVFTRGPKGEWTESQMPAPGTVAASP